MRPEHPEFAIYRRLVRNWIIIAAMRLSVERFGHGLRAIVLTGSMARHEGTIVQEDGIWRVLGDAEFLLIFQEYASLPDPAEVSRLSQAVEASLRVQQVACPIGLAPAKPSYLRTLPPHIFGYELRECGRVVWGDASILSSIPSFSAADIPVEDGWRLLSNRIVEHLEIARSWTVESEHVPPSLQHHTMKLCLDTAGSFLLFAGAYAPTYSQRQKAVEYILEKGPASGRYSFLQKSFARHVDFCTRWKLGTLKAGAETKLAWSFWESVVAAACAVWRWELSVLTGLATHADFHELCRRSMRAQTARQKIRGWLLVWRETGWLRSWRKWPGWISKVRQGSPRQYVYLAAFELFSKLSALLENQAPDPELDTRWAEVRDWLPLTSRREDETTRADWRQLASEIAWNYHAFVEKTRA